MVIGVIRSPRIWLKNSLVTFCFGLFFFFFFGFFVFFFLKKLIYFCIFTTFFFFYLSDTCDNIIGDDVTHNEFYHVFNKRDLLIFLFFILLTP
jgi:hypothetical protein